MSIWVGAAEKQVWIRFVDTGPGIDREERELGFEPYYHGDQNPNIKQGMGLGLSIAGIFSMLMAERSNYKPHQMKEANSQSGYQNRDPKNLLDIKRLTFGWIVHPFSP